MIRTYVYKSVSVCFVILSKLTIILRCARKEYHIREVIGKIENRIGHGYAI